MGKSKAQQLAAVRIGYRFYLLPAANAAKVVELLSQGIECDDHYGDGEMTYTIGKPIELEYRIVRPSQVRRPAGDDDDSPITIPGRITARSGVQGLLPAPVVPLHKRMKL